jgi:putative MATE family efflux protein
MILPCVLEQLLILLVGIADTLMISYTGEAAVSGVSLVNQMNNIFILAFGAVASGGGVVVSQYIGKRDRENGSLSASQLVMITAIFGALSALLVLVFGEGLFSLLYGQVEPAVREAGMIYLIISAYSFPALAVYNACSSVFRAMGDTKTVMKVSLFMNVINVIGNAIGVFALRAGVAGVAYPSLIARTAAMAAMVYLASRPEKPVRIFPRQIFSWHQDMVRRILRIALPNGVENGLFQLSKVAVTAILALFSTTQIAAYGVAQNFWMTASLFGVATGPVFTAVVGQYMGAGDVEGADYYIKKLMRLTMLGALPWNLFSLLFCPLLLMLYSISAETARLVVILVFLHNVFNTVVCPLGFSLSNGLRAAGDARYTMWVAIFATVVCRFVFSLLFAVTLNLGVIGITWAMICDWAVKAVLIVSRYRSGKWKRFQVI